MNRFLISSLSVALAGAAFGQTDECVVATDLGMGPTSGVFDTNMAVDTGVSATTSPEAECFSISGDVWFKYTASATGTATFSTCGAADFDTEIGVYEGADCSTFDFLGCNDDTLGCAGGTSQLTVPVTAGNVYHVNVGYFSNTLGTFGSGTMTITEAAPPSNDDCSTPDVAMLGTTMFDNTAATSSGFNGGGGCASGANTNNQDLFYTFTAAVGGIYTFDTVGSGFDTRLTIHDGVDCMATCLVDDDDGAPISLESLIEIGLDAGQTVLVQAGAVGTGSGDMGLLNINLTGTFCDVDDAFEINIDCATAAPVADGTFTDLNATDTNQDYYSVSVADGATIDASILFVDANGDLDLYLWDPTVGCDTNVAGTGGPFLARGFSSDDDEVISYTNMSGATQNLIIEVDMFSFGGCNRYDLVVSGTGDGVGTPFCLTTANSSGAPAAITGSGSASLSANDLVLTVSSLPVHNFGFVIASQERGFMPMPIGSMGNLCLAGDIGRGVGGQVYNSGASGTYMAPVDWTAVPAPTGSIAAMVGDTFNFQAWTRDSMGGTATSNLSNGLSVMVQ